MVTAVEDIIIFNLRYDSSMRREVFIPTTISGVSLYHKVGVTVSGGQGADNREENIDWKIRIPITAEVEDGRQYIHEKLYKELTDEDAAGYWTIQKGCYIIPGTISGDRPTDMDALRAYDGEFITVVDYADNTRRGSDIVKHWRIGGA